LPSAPGKRHGTGVPTRQLNCRTAALLATMALGAVATFLPGAAGAVDATWVGGTSGDFDTASNWNPNTAVPTGTASFATSGTTSLSFSATTTIGGWTFNAGASNYTFTNDQALTFNGAGIAINGGSAAITNNSPGTLNFDNASTAGSATITNNNSLQFNDTSTAGSAFITNGGLTAFNNTSTAGSATILNGGLLQFLVTSTAGTATILNVNNLLFLANSTAGSATINNNGGTTEFTALTTAGSATINNMGTSASVVFTNNSTAGNAAINNSAGSITFNGLSTAGNATITNALFVPQGSITFSDASTAGNAAITNNSGGVVDFSASIGPNFDNRLSAGSIAGAGTFFLGANQLTVGGNDLSTVVSGVISDGGAGGGIGGSLVKVGTGTLTLTGINTYTGATTVDAGTLQVNGSIAPSVLTSVNNGGTMSGIGTAGATQINSGGTFAPGNGTPGTFLVSGSLAFQAGAIYMVQVNPVTSSLASVTGSATLGGATVNAVFANGSFVARRYTILTAGSVSGTFNPAVVNTNLPSGFKTSLSYDATDAFLNLALSFVPPAGSGLNGNQQAVGNAITGFFNSTGSIPLVFGGLTPAGLTQISGETATGSQQTTFEAMGLFMGLLTDPFMQRSGTTGPMPGAIGYADEALGYAANRRTDAFAMFTKAPPAFEQRWSVWASGFGGSQTTSGNAAVGSNDTTSRIAGTAVGADYLISPTTIAGFALAGGGTNFSVANGGTGRSDLFQAGAYLLHTNGPAYVSAALAFGWQDITTNRIVTVAGFDQLRAEFNADAWSGRLEGGYRFVQPWLGGIGITPYAAAQFVTFDLPAYAEQAIVGTNNFALAYGARDVTDVRSELGIRADKSYALANGILTLRGRLAWAHDFDPDRSIAATFQSLPGASFVVNGAAQAFDSALTTASVEMKWRNGWSAAATFEGEFSNVTQSYAGKGVVRYTF